MAASLDRGEVLGVHPRDAMGNLLERLPELFAALTNRATELDCERVSNGTSGQSSLAAGGTLTRESLRS